MNHLLNLIVEAFRCSHSHCTFPMTHARTGEIRVTCLDCGKAFAYDWQTMTRGREVSA